MKTHSFCEWSGYVSYLVIFINKNDEYKETKLVLNKNCYCQIFTSSISLFFMCRRIRHNLSKRSCWACKYAIILHLYKTWIDCYLCFLNLYNVDFRICFCILFCIFVFVIVAIWSFMQRWLYRNNWSLKMKTVGSVSLAGKHMIFCIDILPPMKQCQTNWNHCMLYLRNENQQSIPPTYQKSIKNTKCNSMQYKNEAI